MTTKKPPAKRGAKSTRDAIPGLAARIKDLRQASGMTPEQLAAAAGTSYSSVKKLESGHRYPSLRLARDIATALGITLDTLCPPEFGRNGAK